MGKIEFDFLFKVSFGSCPIPVNLTGGIKNGWQKHDPGAQFREISR